MSSRYKVITYSIIFSMGALMGLLFEVFLSGGGLGDLAKGNFGGQRFPQSIRRDKEEMGSVLQMMDRDKLINSIEIEHRNHELDIVMENPILREDKDQKIFACGYFDTARFEFEANGVMVEGERPSVVVEAPCTAQADSLHLNPIHLPLMEIAKGKPTDSEMTFRQKGQWVKVTLKDSPPQWPESWTLKRVTLSNSKDSSRSLEVPYFEAGMGRRNQIVMRW